MNNKQAVLRMDVLDRTQLRGLCLYFMKTNNLQKNKFILVEFVLINILANKNKIENV